MKSFKVISMKKKQNSPVFVLPVLGIFFLAGFLIFFNAAFHMKAEAAGDKIITVVIDPGHGGENQGALYNNVREKELTLRVAYAMKRELENYDGVKVYLTRDEDDGLELDERAEFAKEMGADILLSLHFNMSESHLNSGCEMWISSQGILKTRAMEFATVENELLKQLGLSKSMTNTRLNEFNQDYYGVIRETAMRQIPACIIEHCYLDCPEEYQFYDSYPALEQLGKLDATAVAMTYHLKSDKLGMDYSNLQKKNIKLPARVTQTDITGPLYVETEVVGYKKKKNRFLIDINVLDNESSIVDYQYSLTGGNGFSEPIPIFTYSGKYTVEVPALMNESLIIRVGNAYGLHMDSDVIDMNPYYEKYVTDASNQSEKTEVLDRLEEEMMDSDIFEPAVLLSDEWWVDKESLPVHRLTMVFGGLFGLVMLAGYMALHFFYLNHFSHGKA